MSGIIIYGPQGCGKSRDVEKLARHYQKDMVIDAWSPGDPLPDNALALTNVETPGAIAYEVAINLMRKKADNE